MKFSEVLKQATESLSLAGNSEAMLDAWYLMEEVSKMSRTQWYLNCQNEMPEEKQKEFNRMLLRLLAGEPVSYIIGTRGFMGYDFVVDENVLIPRQDTELLVEEALRIVGEEFGKVSDNKGNSYSILDMCTGSGCIAISIDKMLKESNHKASVTATDISEGALRIAALNNEKLGADVELIQSDMFGNVAGKYNMIVSNPPYIPKVQMDELDKKVVEYEPYSALYGGNDGLDFYRIIAREAGAYLEAGGWLLLEIGYDQGESVPELLLEYGFENIKVLKDYNNLDRVVTANKCKNK